MHESDNENKIERFAYTGTIKAFLNGVYKFGDEFSSKSEMKEIMEDWRVRYSEVALLEISIMFDK